MRSRKSLLFTLGMATTLMFASACGAASGADTDTTPTPDSSCVLPSGAVTAENQCKFPGETLRVSTTGAAAARHLQEGVGTLFESTSGAKIEWVETGPLDMYAALAQASAGGAPPPVDVVIDMYEPTVFNAEKSGVLEPMDTAAIPNLADVPQEAYSIDGFGPAFYFLTINNCVNTDVYAQAGVPLPTSWDEVLAASPGKIGFPDPNSPRWDQIMAGLAAHYGAAADAPAEVVDRIAAVKDRITTYSSAADSDALIQGGQVATLISSEGRCLGLKSDGAPVDNASLGLDGTNEVVGSLVGPQIAKGTEKTELAMAFINTLFTKEALLPFVTNLVFTPTKPDAVEAMLADPVTAEFVRTGFDNVLQPDFAAFVANRAEWVDAWNRAFQ